MKIIIIEGTAFADLQKSHYSRITAIALDVLADAKQMEPEWEERLFIDRSILERPTLWLADQQLPSGAFQQTDIKLATWMLVGPTITFYPQGSCSQLCCTEVYYMTFLLQRHIDLFNI